MTPRGSVDLLFHYGYLLDFVRNLGGASPPRANERLGQQAGDQPATVSTYRRCGGLRGASLVSVHTRAFGDDAHHVLDAWVPPSVGLRYAQRRLARWRGHRMCVVPVVAMLKAE